MATSSSAKKVARLAAKSGGGSQANKQSNWLFPASIAVILVLGIGIVVFARSENGGGNDPTTQPRAQLAAGETYDHWHAAFAIDVCGKELAPVPLREPDTLGIHTHSDGLIHIHPFSLRSSGKNATMKRFFDQTDLKVTNSGFRLPSTMDAVQGGRTFETGETTCGGKPGELVMAFWKSAVEAPTTKPDKIYTKDFGDIRFTEDFEAYTLAFVEKGDRDIPAPSTSADIETLGACDGENPPEACNGVTGETIPGTGSSGTVPESTEPGSDTTATTAAAETTVTTAGAAG